MAQCPFCRGEHPLHLSGCPAVGEGDDFFDSSALSDDVEFNIFLLRCRFARFAGVRAG